MGPLGPATPPRWGAYGVAYGTNKFVAVGGYTDWWTGRAVATVVTSTTGATWTQSTISLDSILSDIAYGNGLFVAVGTKGAIVTSPTGAAWTRRTSGVTEHLYDVAYGAGVFAAAGLNGVLLTSTNGVNWTRRSLPTKNNFLNIAFVQGRFMVAGVAGTLLVSDPLLASAPALALQFLPGQKGPNLILTGAPGQNYRLQATTDLVPPLWLDLTTLTPVTGATSWVDTVATNLPRRFYRVVAP
jgi:hypothetical protein